MMMLLLEPVVLRIMLSLMLMIVMTTVMRVTLVMPMMTLPLHMKFVRMLTMLTSHAHADGQGDDDEGCDHAVDSKAGSRTHAQV